MRFNYNLTVKSIQVDLSLPFTNMILSEMTTQRSVLHPTPNFKHHSDVIMSAMTSQITDVSIVCSSVCSGADQRRHQSSASLAFMRGIHRRQVDSPHKGPVTRKMFLFDDVIIQEREAKPPLDLGHEWVIASHFCKCIYCSIQDILLWFM